MRLITVTLAAAGLLATASQAYAAGMSDVEYLKANRCRGLAEADLASVDVAAMDALLKTEGRNRSAYVAERGRTEMDKARREAKTENTERKARLTAELNGPCQVYKG